MKRRQLDAKFDQILIEYIHDTIEDLLTLIDSACLSDMLKLNSYTQRQISVINKIIAKMKEAEHCEIQPIKIPDETFMCKRASEHSIEWFTNGPNWGALPPIAPQINWGATPPKINKKN